MSNLHNDSILESLFEKHWDRIKSFAPELSNTDVDILAERAAQDEFEKMGGSHG